MFREYGCKRFLRKFIIPLYLHINFIWIQNYLKMPKLWLFFKNENFHRSAALPAELPLELSLTKIFLLFSNSSQKWNFLLNGNKKFLYSFQRFNIFKSGAPAGGRGNPPPGKRKNCCRNIVIFQRCIKWQRSWKMR